MLTRLLATLALFCALALGPAAAQSSDGAASAEADRAAHAHTTPEDRALLGRIRAGGVVLYTRHERTNMRVLDGDDFDPADCDTQRNLSVAGIAVAREVGENLRDLGVPVGPVYASPTCRTRETARLLYGGSTVEPGFYVPGRSREAMHDMLRELFARPIPEGENMAVVAHIGHLRSLTGVALGEGDTAVLDPDDLDPETAAPRVLGVVRSNVWNDLALDLVFAAQTAE